MPIYTFSKKGILKYFTEATKSVQSIAPVKLTNKFKEMTNFFSDRETKDYNIILGALKTEQEKYQLWQYRLMHVCTALLYVLEELKYYKND